MLRTNLSTRPFYNERAVRVGIGLVVVLTAALTAFNAAEILSLNSRNSELVSKAEAAEGKAADMRAQAVRTQQSLNAKEVAAVAAAAREANELIDRRAFSWTDLFNRFEETLPADVRIISVAPQIDSKGRMLVAVTVVSKSGEVVEDFQDRLEATGAFREMLPRNSELMDDGTTRSILQGYYLQGGTPAAAVSPAAASEAVEATPRPDKSSGSGQATNSAPPRPSGRGEPQ